LTRRPSHPTHSYTTARDSAIINAAVARYGGIFLFSGRDHVRAGIDRDCVFFIEDRDGTRIFEATSFEQVMELSQAAEPRATLTSERGDRYVGSVSFDLERDVSSESVYPSTLRTDVRWLGADDFQPVVEGLRTVFGAAVEIDHPVFWS